MEINLIYCLKIILPIIIVYFTLRLIASELLCLKKQRYLINICLMLADGSYKLIQDKIKLCHLGKINYDDIISLKKHYIEKYYNVEKNEIEKLLNENIFIVVSCQNI